MDRHRFGNLFTHLLSSGSGGLAGSGRSEIQFSDFKVTLVSYWPRSPEEFGDDSDDRTHHASDEDVTSRRVGDDGVTATR
jgi:hypothetical protein